MNLAAAPTAVIAEDEPVLARTLTRLLAQAVARASHRRHRRRRPAGDRAGAGHAARRDVPRHQDARPQRDLEVAEAVADDWPDDRAEPLFVFITAYDNFAVPAFERAAVDYLLKPATAERLQQTVERLKARLAGRSGARPMPATGPR